MPSAAESRLAAALVALALGTSVAGGASAYCRSTTCEANAELGIQGAACQPEQPTDCGSPLRWERDCVGYAVQEDASDYIDYETAHDILAQAFATWESADCGMGSPGIHVMDLGSVECDRVEYEPNAGNANILIFRDGDWQENGYDKLALTTVNYDKETGEIWNADIEVNTADYTFKQSAKGGEYDLLGVLTHEAGHFLGLAHSADLDATMFDTYHDEMVDLTEDDASGICTIYPPRDFDRDACNPIPRHGFSPVCASRQTEGQCTTTAPERRTTPGDAPLLPIAACIGLLALRRRKKPPALTPPS